MTQYTCSIQGCPFSTTSPLGMSSHGRRHRNRFERLVGRRPASYAEVRRFFNGDQSVGITTLTDFTPTCGAAEP